jgi:hypothetical protein
VTDLDPFLKQDPRSTFPAQQMPSANIWPRPTRVAIIDNGVDAGITKIWDRVAESQSFVEFNETRESTVWLASHPHGTQMASIVIDIDPRCLLYIAKVGIGAHDFVSADNIIAVSGSQILKDLPITNSQNRLSIGQQHLKSTLW